MFEKISDPLARFIVGVVITCVALAGSSHGIQAPNPSKEFVRRIDSMQGFPSKWEEVSKEAELAGITADMSMDSWKELLEVARKSSLKSRCAIQLHPLRSKKEYFNEIMHVLGHDSDVFTRVRVFSIMRMFFPGERVCPKFGLLLVLDCWNAEWPERINAHGNSPRAVLSLGIENQWNMPAGSLTAEICGKLLSESERWKFDQTMKTWGIPLSDKWLPQLLRP